MDHMKCRRSKNAYMKMAAIYHEVEEICRDNFVRKT